MNVKFAAALFAAVALAGCAPQTVKVPVGNVEVVIAPMRALLRFAAGGKEPLGRMSRHALKWPVVSRVARTSTGLRLSRSSPTARQLGGEHATGTASRARTS
jgi:hypothetical protein